MAEEYPFHVVCAWNGNSQPVAVKHYLQVMDEGNKRAARVAESVAPNVALTGDSGRQRGPTSGSQATVTNGKANPKRDDVTASVDERKDPLTTTANGSIRVEDRGLERDSVTPCSKAVSGSPALVGGAKSGALGAQNASIDPDLPNIIEAWHTLPEAVRARIVAMVEAADQRGD